MDIAQDVYFIPDDIATGLATGIYRRIGSVVRFATGPNKGRIVKHLDPIDLKNAKQAKIIGASAINWVKNHKKGTIIVLVGAAAVGTGTWIYNKAKHKEPKVVTEFKQSMRVYIDAIRNGSMDIKKIDDLIDKLEQLKLDKNYEKISIQLTAEELDVLVGRIYEYTVKLAQDNNVIINEDEEFAMNANSDSIISLQKYLEAQRNIFNKAA